MIDAARPLPYGLSHVREVWEDEATPRLLSEGVEPIDPSKNLRAAWYITGSREDGIPMCQVLRYHWDMLEARWIQAGPRTPVVEGGILEQPLYDAPIAVALSDVRGNWRVKVRFYSIP